jgi:UDPglucose 6-dehydrogenase
MNELYAPFLRQGNPIYFMDERSSELTKYAANAFLATKITFMNEVANLCERTGANVDAVRIGIGSDSRIGKRFLFAGIGYGGSCFPKDVQALQHTAQEHRYDFRILDAVMQVNEAQKQVLVNKLLDYYGGALEGKRIALWGLAFKPETDDIREAPALEIIEALLGAGAHVAAYDPEAMNNVRALLGDRIEYAKDPYEAAHNAEALLIATEWAVFRTPDFAKLKGQMSAAVIFDGRNLYDLEKMEETGFFYSSIGRKTVHSGMNSRK